MKQTIYQTARVLLKEAAKNAKNDYPNDKPAIRQIINDTADGLSKDLKLSDYQRDLLSNYSCNLHAKYAK